MKKITWGKLDINTPKFIVESDATIVAPLIFAWYWVGKRRKIIWIKRLSQSAGKKGAQRPQKFYQRAQRINASNLFVVPLCFPGVLSVPVSFWDSLFYFSQSLLLVSSSHALAGLIACTRFYNNYYFNDNPAVCSLSSCQYNSCYPIQNEKYKTGNNCRVRFFFVQRARPGPCLPTSVQLFL